MLEPGTETETVPGSVFYLETQNMKEVNQK